MKKKYEDFCQPSNYTGPYSRRQAQELVEEAEEWLGVKGKGRHILFIGTVKNPHSQDNFESREEMLAQMWAMRLCEHPETAWYNDPRDPGIVSNEKFTRKMFDQLPDHFKARVNKIISEDNAACDESETESIDEAARNLIEAASRAAKALKYVRTMNQNDMYKIRRNLESAIDDMVEWMDSIAEQNASPVRSGLVGHDGRP